MNPSHKWVGAVALLISGCSYLQAPPEAPQQHSLKPALISLSEVQCQPMPVTGDQQQFSANIGQEGQYLQLPSGTTPFLAYTLPADIQKIDVQSYPMHAGNYEKAEIFYPEVALLDRNNEIVRTINKVKYQKQGIISVESLATAIRLNYAEDRQAACLLIYTTDKARAEKTTLMNQAKEYARVRGIVPPPIADIAARHGDQGKLNISIKQGDTPALTSMLPTANQQPVPDTFNNAMRSHYLDGTRTAIAEKNVKQAMSLRTEFNNVLQATEGYFVSQFGRDKSKIIEPSAPFEQEGFAGKAIYHYQSETYRYLTTGQASSALKLQDSLKQLQHQLDAIFDKK